MGLSDMLEKLLQTLGIRKSDTRKYELIGEKLRSSYAVNADQLDALKEQVGTLERNIRSKKREYESSAGDTKRIIGGEIERLFRDIDRLRGKETIITRNLDKIALAQAKIDELIAAQQQGIDEDMLDDLAVDLEDIFAELKSTDRTAKSLASVNYEEAAKSPAVDIESRMAQLDGTQSESSPISAETKARLKELEEE